MDEGDDYVPQMSQLGDYGASMGMGGPSAVAQPYPAMTGGLTPMNNPYEQQQMMMLQPPQQPPQPPPAKPAATKRSKKKQEALDPMQSMAAMSNNPMMRPSMQHMGGMYPQQNQMGMYGQGAAPQPSPHYPGQPAYRPGPQQYPPQQGYPMQPQMGYPQQQRGPYPAGPAPGQPPGYGYAPQGGYPQGAQAQYANMRPQYPPNQQMPGQAQYWDQQQYYQGMHANAPQGAPAVPEWVGQAQQSMYGLEMEVRNLQARLQQMYQTPQRTPMMDQEAAQMQHRIQYLQTEHQRIHMQLAQHSAAVAGGANVPQPAGQMQPNPMTQQMPTPGMQSSAPQAGVSQQSMVSIQHQGGAMSSATPVQVTQSGQQVQVNIKPEQSGRTLISVYHRYGESPNGSNGDEQKDSVPPEPIPTNLYAQQPNQHQMVSMDNAAAQQMQHQQQQMISQNQHQMQNQLPPAPFQQHTNGSMENGYAHANMNNVDMKPTVAPVPAYQEPPQQAMDEASSYEEQMRLQEQEEQKQDELQLQQQQQQETHRPPQEVNDDVKNATEYDASLMSNNEPTTFAEPVPMPIIDERDVATPPMRIEMPMEEAPSSSQEDESSTVFGEPSTSQETDQIVNDEIESKYEEQEEEKPASTSETAEVSPQEDIDMAEPECSQDSDETKEEIKEEEEEEEDRDDEQTEASTLMEVDEPPPESSKADDSTSSPSQENEDEPGPSEVATPAESEPTVAESVAESSPVASASVKDEDKEPTPSEIADSQDGVFTEPSTPAPEAKKAKKPPPARSHKKKPKYVDDSGDDDDDFVPEFKQKKAKKPAVKKEKDDEKKESKWDVDDDDDEFGEDSNMETATQESVGDQFIVEKILNIRDVPDEEPQFLAKWKNKAYRHCEWKTGKELEEIDKRVSAKIKRFTQKRATALVEPDDEDFNADFLLVDRIVDIALGPDEKEYVLVKWKSLAYDEVTWEPIEEIENEWKPKVDLWRDRQKIDKAKTKEKSRPDPTKWKQLDQDHVWKNDNELRLYQYDGVDWLLYCYYEGRNCILADEMGLGKTVQTITFLSEIYEYGIHGPFLIVVPLSTIQNWVREFEAWTDMNAVVYHGSAHGRQILQDNEIYYNKEHSNGNKAFKKPIVKLDALITTFEMVVTDCEFLKKINWRVCVIDEAHRLKNRNCKLLTGGLHSFKMEHRVLLTGTPLQNNVDELFSLLNFLHPDQFASSVEFLAEFGTCQTDEQVQKLQEILKPMMLRRLKEDVEKSLQPKQETIIEVQLSDCQKKYYRAILERNFSHLCKGSSAPSLMNVMMELRKCCNHPFLIQGAEESIISEMRLQYPELDEDALNVRALIQASGKVVLIEKLLPKLKKDGHKVLIFSQMVKVLDLLEDFLIHMGYSFERIDGNVRGDIRQQSIDRFSKKDSDRFAFLLCTRAGGLGINLTAADTVIIFDSDWNPQNDLQAQARCHRIGQTKTVKVYRLVTSNTYEREMFEKASLKLGLDKAVLQSTTALRESSTSLSKKDVEELLKKGAYGSIMDENNEGSKFSEEDIETILQRRTTTITLEPGQKGSLFSKATFNSTHNKGDDIDIDDPNFWTKWAEKAQVDVEKATATPDGRELIMQEPRKRTKRFEDNSLKEGEESDGGDEKGGSRKRGANTQQNANRKRRRGEDEDGDYVNYRPDELAFNKSDYFKVEKVLASFGWGRWSDIRKAGDPDIQKVSEMDIMHMSRTLLLHCIRVYRGDDRIKKAVWALIVPHGAKHSRETKDSYTEGWAVLPEYNPPNFALDNTFQRHIHRHANKLLVKIDQLNHLHKTMIGGESVALIESGADWKSLNISVPSLMDPLCDGWDADCDKSMLIGIYRHGLEGVDAMRVDPLLVFASKTIEPFPGPVEIGTRFKRLIAVSQRNILDPVYEKPKWSRREEQEFMRVLRNFGMKDRSKDNTSIDWDAFRNFSPHLTAKPDSEMQEYLYCVLAMCTKVQGNELSAMDLKRANSIDALPMNQALKLMNRLHLTRKVHTLVGGVGGLEKHTSALQLCLTDAMPAGWNIENDKELLAACNEHGLENLCASTSELPSFQKIIRPNEKVLLRRVIEVCTTLETGKWNGPGNIDSIDDTEEIVEKTVKTPTTVRSRGGGGGRKRTSTSDDSKMRAMLQQSMLSQMNDQTLVAAMLQSAMFMPGLLGGSSSSNSASNNASAQMLASLFALAGAGGTGASTSSANQQQQAMATLLALAATGAGGPLDMDALNLTKKTPSTSSASVSKSSSSQKAVAAAPVADPTPSTSSASTSASAAAAAAAASMQPDMLAAQMGINITDMLLLASLPPDTSIPVRNIQTNECLAGEGAPKLKNITSWLNGHPNFRVDLTVQSSSPATIKKQEPSTSSGMDSAPASAKPSAPPTPKAATPRPASKAPTPAPSTPAHTPLPAASPSMFRLEPGEVPKKAATATATITGGSTLDGMIACFNRTNGTVLPATSWPQLATLAPWLDSHPECNVHSTCVNATVQALLGPAYTDRLGGDQNPGPSTSKAEKTVAKQTPSTSVSNRHAIAAATSSAAAEAKAQAAQMQELMQMQLLMQQAVLQQSLLGFNPYAMPSTSSTQKQQDDALNPLLMASLMSNPLALQALMMDPSMLMSLTAPQPSAPSSSKKSKQPPQ